MVMMIEELREQFDLLTEDEKLNFVTAAMSNDPSHSQLVQDFMQLSKAKQHEFLLKALHDSAWRKSGAGVGDDVALKNKNSMKAGGGTVGGVEKKNTHAVDHEKDIIRNAVKETFGVSDGALDRMIEIVEQVTDAKATDESRNGFLKELKNVFAKYGGYFLDDGEADLVEQLCDRIQWLESEIAAAEAEGEQLRRGLEEKQRRQSLANEEVERKRRSKKAKRSFWEEDTEPGEWNRDMLFNEHNDAGNQNKLMSKYLDRIERDAAYVKKS